MRVNVRSAHDHVRTKQWMNLPHRRTQNVNSLDQDIPTSIEFDKARSQISAFAKLPLLNRHIRINHFPETVPRRLLISPALPRTSTSLPLPPVFIAGLPIQCAFTRHRDIFLLERINQRRVVVAFHSLEPRQNDRNISFRVGRESQYGATSQVKFDIALQMNWTGKKLAFRNNHFPTGLVTRLNRFAYGNRTIRPAISRGSEIGDYKFAGGKCRNAN